MQKEHTTHLELWPDVWYMAEIDSAVLDTKEFMDHGLIGPLSQQWSYRVVSSVDNKKYGRGIGLPEVEQLFLLGHLVSNLCS